jgi:hypothetical protein
MPNLANLNPRRKSHAKHQAKSYGNGGVRGTGEKWQVEKKKPRESAEDKLDRKTRSLNKGDEEERSPTEAETTKADHHSKLGQGIIIV